MIFRTMWEMERLVMGGRINKTAQLCTTEIATVEVDKVIESRPMAASTMNIFAYVCGWSQSG